MNAIRRILFVELLGGIGDVLIALPAIHALGLTYPTAHLTVLTFPAGAELLTSDPLIHQVVLARRGEARRSLEDLLAEQSFDVIVSDTNYDSIPEIIHHSGAKRVVTNLWRSPHLNHGASPPDDERVGDRFLHILEREGVIAPVSPLSDLAQLHLSPSERLHVRAQLGAMRRPLIVLITDAGMAIKRWPDGHFIRLGQQIRQQYGGTILVPVGADAESAKRIVRAIDPTRQHAHLWPRGTLRQLAALLALADGAIAADTGPARIAAAVGTPTITLFGPSWHGRYGQPAPHRNLQGVPHCPERVIANFTEQPCWYSGECPFEWQTCLEDISPETVLRELSTLLTPAPAPARPTPPRLNLPLFSPARLLLLRLDNIGDVIMTTPTLRSLREALPQTHITLMASPGGAQVAPLLPWVDEVLPWRVLWQDLGQLSFDPHREWELIATLRSRQFDAAIILTSFSQSPHPAGLICALAGIPVRIGESKEHDWGTLTHAIPPLPDRLHQVDRNLNVVEALGLPVSDRHLALAIPDAARGAVARWLFPHSPKGYVLLNPWTSCPSRNYDPHQFAIAARALSDRTRLPVVITGMEKDRPRTQPLFETLGDRAIDLMGQTTLPELVALVEGAAILLTNNTSTMHMADATRTPQVVMFAGTEYECQWEPRAGRSRLLRQPTVCSPCYAFSCRYDLPCLAISSDRVLAAALELLQEGDTPCFLQTQSPPAVE